MSTLVSDTLKARGDGGFPVVMAEDVQLSSTDTRSVKKAIEDINNGYATKTTAGIVKVGDHIEVKTDGTISVDENDIYLKKDVYTKDETDQTIKTIIGSFIKKEDGTTGDGTGENQKTKSNETPIGTIISYIGTTPPEHYLPCDGNIYDIADYKELTDFFVKEFGKVNYYGGDGVTTFAVPNRGGIYLSGDGLIQDISKSGTAFTNSALGTYPGYTLDGPFDPKSTTAWFSSKGPDSLSASEVPHYGFKFNTGKLVTKMRITNMLYGSYWRCNTFDVEASDDGTNWDKVGNGSLPANNTPQDITLTSTKYYTYYRIVFTSTVGAGANYSYGIGDIKLYGYDVDKYMIKYESTYYMSVLHNDSYVSEYYENYSEEEVVIGKYINGKPLYRKIFTTFKYPATTNGTFKNVEYDLSFLDFDEIANMNMIWYNSPNYQKGPYTTNNGYQIKYQVNVSTKQLILVTNCGGLENMNTTFTIEYTKTTDAIDSFTSSMIYKQYSLGDLPAEATQDEVDAVFA